MYWTMFKIYRDGDFSGIFKEFVAVDDFIYSFFNASNRIGILNTNTLEYKIKSVVSDINDIPCGIRRSTIVVFDEKMYLWGGINIGGESNILYSFDTKSLKWSRPQVSGIIPSLRYLHSACISIAECKIYIFGGLDINTHKCLRDVHCLDLKTMNWSNIITTGEVPYRTRYLTAVVDNRMYVHGGYDVIRGTYCTDTMYLDLNLNEWHHLETTGNIPVGDRDHHFLFVHNNLIYFFRSCNDSSYRDLNDLYYLDTNRNHWNLINPRGKSPKLRCGQPCIVNGDKMFLLQENSSGFDINVLDFNPSLKTLAIMSIIENGLDFSCLPKALRSQVNDFKSNNI